MSAFKWNSVGSPPKWSNLTDRGNTQVFMSTNYVWHTTRNYKMFFQYIHWCCYNLQVIVFISYLIHRRSRNTHVIVQTWVPRPGPNCPLLGFYVPVNIWAINCPTSNRLTLPIENVCSELSASNSTRDQVRTMATIAANGIKVDEYVCKKSKYDYVGQLRRQEVQDHAWGGGTVASTKWSKTIASRTASRRRGKHA